MADRNRDRDRDRDKTEKLDWLNKPEKIEKNDKKKKFNVFDIIIVIVVLAIAGGAYVFTHRTQAKETQLLRYSLELNECPEGFSQNIKVGDKLTDNVKNYNMGTITSVEARPSIRLGEDKINGNVIESTLDGKETVIIVVEANVIEDGPDFKVDGGYVVKAGRDVSVKGNGYAGRGFILTIGR